MINRDKVKPLLKEATDASERALLEQAHSYRAPKLALKSFAGQAMNPKAKKALIATCFIPLLSFVAGVFAIYFGREAFRETKGGQDRGHWVSVLALVAGSITMIPLLLLVFLSIRNGLLTSGL